MEILDTPTRGDQEKRRKIGQTKNDARSREQPHANFSTYLPPTVTSCAATDAPDGCRVFAARIATLGREAEKIRQVWSTAHSSKTIEAKKQRQREGF